MFCVWGIPQAPVRLTLNLGFLLERFTLRAWKYIYFKCWFDIYLKCRMYVSNSIDSSISISMWKYTFADSHAHTHISTLHSKTWNVFCWARCSRTYLWFQISGGGARSLRIAWATLQYLIWRIFFSLAAECFLTALTCECHPSKSPPCWYLSPTF